nr:hypothetical protein [Tanacetum cinerariifolium]
LVQLAQGFLLGIFLETMQYRVLVLLISGWMGGCDKPLRLTDILLYPWDGELDVCVDLTGSLSLTQTGMVDFVPGRVFINAAQRKRKANTVTLLKRIRMFSMTQDIGACAAAHIFNRISFAIAKGVGALISQLPSNFLYIL